MNVLASPQAAIPHAHMTSAAASRGPASQPLRAVASVGSSHLRESSRAVIVGGGLGGLTAALALRKIGMDAHVYERREVIAGGEGTMIVIAPNGINALHAINPDLVPQVLEAGIESPYSEVYSRDGTLLAKTRMGYADDGGGLMFGAPFVAIGWNRALSILRDALPADAIHTGHTFVGLEQTDECATVHFTSAQGDSITEQAALVVGADGIRSKVRKEVLGLGNDAVVDAGRMVFRALVAYDTNSRHIQGLQRGTNYAYVGAPTTFFASDAGSNLLYLAFTVLDSVWEEEERKEGGGGGGEEDRGRVVISRLRRLFRGCQMAEEALDVLSPGDLLERRVQHGPLLSQWVSNRTVIIGDAAHAITPAIGQGANQAFEDGLDLSFFLSQGRDIRESLLRFQEYRIPRVQMVQSRNSNYGNNAYKKPGGRDMKAWTQWDDIYTYKGASSVLLK